MLGTYVVALGLIAFSLPVGSAVLWLCGRREWSWLAPVLGLAVLTVAAWLLVRLPGEGLAALIGVCALALVCLPALPATGFGGAQLLEGAIPALIALVAVSIPFAAEGHVGILGTGFNVDMSQHLFTAAWIADPIARPPTLIGQGYPVGPHSLAVAGSELSGGNLVSGFTGVTIAVPVVGALTALAATRELGPRRGAIAAPLVALPYLVASYLAQGAFKEIFAATFLLAFAIWLWELSRRQEPIDARGWAVPGAVLVAGMLYAYSGPGLAWIIGTIGVWAVLGLLRSPSAALAKVRPALAGLGIGLLALVLLVAPEASRIADFGGSAGNVANSRDAEPGAQAPKRPLLAQAGASDAGTEAPSAADPEAEAEPEKRSLDLFDNDLGNLFGDIPALEAFGVWPSGDFRVEPGDGSIPAPVFYLAALLGAAALGVGLLRAWRERDDALVAALAAAVVIWIGALAVSTPYTTAKALQMVAPLLMLVAVRGVLASSFSPLRPRPGIGTALAAAFVLAAAGSSALALANAPVGPERYTAGLAKLRSELLDEPVLILAPADQLAERHGAEFYGWELRGGDPICVEAFPEEGTGYSTATPEGIRYVITIGSKTEPPFTDLEEARRRYRVALWEVPGFDADRAPAIAIDPAQPANCDLGVPDPG